ncbi:TPA: hypothetical protein HA259_07570, partial [Thermoplasmata archaeon]|nr:hypothetical protein [Thermoplasmata archaeon]
MAISAFAALAKPSAADWTGSWTVETPMGGTRAQAVVVGSPDGMMYVAGGIVDASVYNSVPIMSSYNLTSGAWTMLEPMPQGVRGAAGAMGPDGLVYVFSGWNDTGPDPVGETQIYDPLTDTWSLGEEIPEWAWEAKAAVGSDGRIYVCGGEGLGDNLNLTQIYDPETDSWSSGADMPGQMLAGAMASDGDYVYYAGGGMYAATDVFWRYSISMDEWEVLDPLPAARAAHALELGPDGLLYLIGGADSAGNTGAAYATTFVYDPDAGMWSDGPDLDSARKYLGSATLQETGQLFVLGGNDNIVALSSVESLRLFVFDYEVSLSSPSVRAGYSMLVTVDSHFVFVEEESSSAHWYIVSEDMTVYTTGNWSNPTPGPLSFEVAVPELAPPGDYMLVFDWWVSFADVAMVQLWDVEVPFEVLPAEPLEDMIDDMESQIADLEAQLDALEIQVAVLETQLSDLGDSMTAADAALMAEIADLMSDIADLNAAMEAGDEDLMDEIADLQDEVSSLMDEVSSLQTELNHTQNSMDDVQDSVDDVQTSVDNKMDGALGLAIIALLVVVIVLMIVMMVMGRKPKA